MRSYDVVIIGAGAAGAVAAVSAAAKGARVAVLSKEPAGYGNTRISGGGMAAPVLSDEDSPQSFLDDILEAGDHINNEELARVVAENAVLAAAVLEGCGHLFIRDADGRATGSSIPRGGHSHPRSLLSGPAQGVSMARALRDALACSGVDVLEDHIATRILVPMGKVEGIVGLNYLTGNPVSLGTAGVVIATGGAGWIFYPHTDVVRFATGDGYALALDAGAELVDMEQVQFLPFGLTHPVALAGVRCGEASIAGPRGRLLNGQGKVVLEKVNRMSRAQLSRAIAQEMYKGNVTEHGGLLLDLSPNLECEEDRRIYEERRRLGLLDQVRLAYGLRAYRLEEPWDVAPTAHFQMGGVRADSWGRTAVPNLFVAGEAMGGTHGSNRLAAIGLTEALVMGLRVGKSVGDKRLANEVSSLAKGEADKEMERLNGLFGACGQHRPVDLHRRLQKIMWEKVGLVRTEEGLKEALNQLSAIEAEMEDLQASPVRICNGEVRDALELPMMLTTAKAITLSALVRGETRGSHLRIDHPELDDSRWLCNVIVQVERGQMATRVEPKRCN
ncbi:MAG: FAD-dependent oxidoreductase [Candidatus Eisenbacteria bacterium]|nr:FAD-dependent oxidoreductase [Candidatus Eisenbacteria bacterium]